MEVYLNDQEVQSIREALASRRSPGTHEEGKWSVSPLNRSPEAFQIPPGSFPKSVVLRDITLRNVHQKPGATITPEGRAALAQALLEVGVRSLQLTWSNFTDPEALRNEVELLRGNVTPVEIAVEGAGTREHLETAAAAGVDLVQLTTPSVPALNYIYGPIGRKIRRAAWAGEDWRSTVHVPATVPEQIYHVCELVRYGRELGLNVSAGINMLAYATDDYLKEYIPAVASAGATDIGLYDGSSGMGPEAWRYTVSLARQLAPDTRTAVHTHNSFGLAVATALACIQAGAGVVEVSVNGMCSASGQADLAEVAAALEVLYGVETGIRMDKLTQLRKLAEDLTGFKVADNKPITGDLVWFYTEEGIVEENAIEPLLHRCLEPGIFGNDGNYYLGQYSGNSTMMQKLEDLGIQASKKQVSLTLEEVKRNMVLRKRALRDDEVRDIAQGILAASG